MEDVEARIEAAEAAMEDALEARLDAANAAMENVEARLEAVNAAMEGVGARLEAVAVAAEDLEREMAAVAVVPEDLEREMEEEGDEGEVFLCNMFGKDSRFVRFVNNTGNKENDKRVTGRKKKFSLERYIREGANMKKNSFFVTSVTEIIQ